MEKTEHEMRCFSPATLAGTAVTLTWDTTNDRLSATNQYGRFTRAVTVTVN